MKKLVPGTVFSNGSQYSFIVLFIGQRYCLISVTAFSKDYNHPLGGCYLRNISYIKNTFNLC